MLKSIQDPSNCQLNDVEIVILTRNRPFYLVKMAQSASLLQQAGALVWISDNSTNNQTYDLIQELHLSLGYVKRHYDFTAIGHYKQVSNELTRTYCMIAHDDDEFLPEAIINIATQKHELSFCSAIGFNAYISTAGHVSKPLFYSSQRAQRLVTNSRDVVASYFLRPIGHPPFPAYLYQSSFFKRAISIAAAESSSRLNDVLIICLAAEESGVKYSPLPIMLYVIHDNNDTKSIQAQDYINLKRNLSSVFGAQPVMQSDMIRSKYICSRLSFSQNPYLSCIISNYLFSLFLRSPSLFLSIYKAPFLPRLICGYIFACFLLMCRRLKLSTSRIYAWLKK